MDAPPIIWDIDKTTGAFVAHFATHPKQLASVRERIDGSYWNLHLQVLLPYDKAVHPYADPEKAKRHAERWLRLRYGRIMDSMPKPYRPPATPPEPLCGDPFAPHPGGRKRVFKSRR